MDEVKYFKERLDDQIDWYDRKSGRNKTWFHTLQIVQIVTGALIPFLALQVKASQIRLDLAVGLLGVIVAVTGGVLTLCKFQELWVGYRTTAETLKHEKYLYRTGSGPYAVENALQILVERVERVISQENTSWVRIAKAKKDEALGKKGDEPGAG